MKQIVITKHGGPDVLEIEPSPRQAAGNVLPVTAVLRSTERMKVYFQFAR
jgi:hypothetical protein